MQDELRRGWAAICAMAVIYLTLLTFSPPRLCAEDFYPGTNIELTENTRLRLMRFSSPDLSIFKDAVAFLRESRPSAVVLGQNDGFPGSIGLAGNSMHGLIFMPNYSGYEYATIRETEEARSERRDPEAIPRSDIEKTLALAMYHVKGAYAVRFPITWETALRINLSKEILTRVAYNLYDLAPMLDYMKEGRSLGEAFSRYYTGGAFFRLSDTTSLSAGLSLGERHSINAFWKMTTTDLSFTDRSVGIEYVLKDRFTLLGAWDYATYDTYNGLSVEKFRLQTDLSLGESAYFTAEALFRPKESRPENVTVRFSMTLRYPAGTGKAPEDVPDRFRAAELTAEPGELSAAFLSRVRVPIVRVEEIDNDLGAILELKDRSFKEIVGVFYAYGRNLDNYDTSRAMNIFAPNRLSGLDPEDYIKNGGVCIDTAKFIATVLENNEFETKIVRVGSLRSSPHAYTVARDEMGTYYTVDGFFNINEVESVNSFAAAAAAYQQGYTQMILSDVKGRIESVIVSPDMVLLDTLMAN